MSDHFYFWDDLEAPGCTVGGETGNGTEQGTCPDEFVCHANGTCTGS